MKTRRLRWYIFFFALVNFAAASVRAQSIDERHGKGSLVGAWRLVELDRPDASGQIHGVDCTGLFVFTNDGHLSVQVMERNPKPTSANGPFGNATERTGHSQNRNHGVDDAKT